MADNLTLNSPTVAGGKTIATEDIGGIQFQRVKLALGSMGQDLGDVSGVNPLVVEMGGASVGAFGDLITAENTPVIQMDFVYGVNTQTGVTTVVGTGVVDTNASRLRLQTGTSTTGSALFNSRRSAKYRAGQGMTVCFTVVFAAGVANSQQIFGFGSLADGFFVGYNGASYGLLHRNKSVDTWVLQGAWNGDKCNGTGYSGFTINPQLGNVYQIRYPFLGFGAITFWVQNPVTTRWILIHTIQYPNSSTATELGNPSLGYWARVVNTGNTSNLTAYSGSVAAFITGVRSFVGDQKWSTDNIKSGVSTETSVFTLRAATTYNGMVNRGQINVTALSFGNTGNANAMVTCRLRLNATLGGAATYIPISGSTADNGVTITSGNSFVSVDTAQTTASAGIQFFGLSVAGAGGNTIDLTSYGIFLSAGETLTLSISSSNNVTVNAALNWTEDI